MDNPDKAMSIFDFLLMIRALKSKPYYYINSYLIFLIKLILSCTNFYF